MKELVVKDLKQVWEVWGSVEVWGFSAGFDPDIHFIYPCFNSLLYITGI